MVLMRLLFLTRFISNSKLFFLSKEMVPVLSPVKGVNFTLNPWPETLSQHLVHIIDDDKGMGIDLFYNIHQEADFFS